MVKHVVLFKFKSELPADQKAKKMSAIKEALEGLRTKIKELGYIEVGINSNPSETYDLVLISEFTDWDSLKAYVVHPEHQKVSAMIREILETRACVDYEF